MKQNQKGALSNWILKCCIGIVLSCITALIAAAVAAGLILNETIPSQSVPLAVGITQYIAVFIGVLCAGLFVSERKLYAGILVLVTYYFVLISCTILLDGRFETVMPNVIGGILGWCTAMFVSIKQKKNKKMYRQKMRSR